MQRAMDGWMEIGVRRYLLDGLVLYALRFLVVQVLDDVLGVDDGLQTRQHTTRGRGHRESAGQVRCGAISMFASPHHYTIQANPRLYVVVDLSVLVKTEYVWMGHTCGRVRRICIYAYEERLSNRRGIRQA